VLFRQEFASLIRSALDDAEPAHSVTVRVARRGKTAQVEVISERGDGRVSDVIGSMTLPVPEGASSVADA
jgi:hypothetical protein